MLNEGLKVSVIWLLFKLSQSVFKNIFKLWLKEDYLSCIRLMIFSSNATYWYIPIQELVFLYPRCCGVVHFCSTTVVCLSDADVISRTDTEIRTPTNTTTILPQIITTRHHTRLGEVTGMPWQCCYLVWVTPGNTKDDRHIL